jgi:formamidopyrimidine-DNA glycosylase
MPELPEVEVTRQSLAPQIEGAQVQSVRLGKPLRWPLGCDPQSLVGQTIGVLQRRGKYLWMPLETGGLLLHLGMSGSLAFGPARLQLGPYEHFEIATQRGSLCLNDPRRFGAVVWSPSLSTGMAGRLLASLGVEPLAEGFDGALLRKSFAGRRTPIKTALLAGDVVVGVGNIYASEALFSARIAPTAPAGSLSAALCDRLALSIRQTLEDAVALGGSTLRNFSNVHGMAGAFQTQARVYGRLGLPCMRCGATVRKMVQGQRSTYFCPKCQRR